MVWWWPIAACDLMLRLKFRSFRLYSLRSLPGLVVRLTPFRILKLIIFGLECCEPNCLFSYHVSGTCEHINMYFLFWIMERILDMQFADGRETVWQLAHDDCISQAFRILMRSRVVL